MAPVDERADVGGGVEGMADLDSRNALADSLHELLSNRLLHEKSARGRASLTVETVNHEHNGIERPFQIGIAENDNGILAA
jgi:hypothetical protein